MRWTSTLSALAIGLSTGCSRTETPIERTVEAPRVNYDDYPCDTETVLLQSYLFGDVSETSFSIDRLLEVATDWSPAKEEIREKRVILAYFTLPPDLCKPSKWLEDINYWGKITSDPTLQGVGFVKIERSHQERKEEMDK